MERKEPMTNVGYERLSSELDKLKNVERGEVAKEIDAARELGDLKENAEYHSAKEKQALMERRIAELSDILSCAVVIDPAKSQHAKVSFGSTVALLDVETEEEVKYTIVGGPESDPDRSFISYHSPLAKALIGREVGDEVEMHLPGGVTTFEIEAICFEEICFG